MNEQKEISTRIYVLYLFTLVLFGVIAVQLFRVQLEPTTSSIAENGIENVAYANIDLVKIQASRGNIFADGEIKSAIATSVPTYELRLDLVTIESELFEDSVAYLAQDLAQLFKDKSTNEYKSWLVNGRNNGNRYFLLKRNVSHTNLRKLQEFPIFNKGQFQGGLIVSKTTKREKPFGFLASRTIGYLNAVDTVVGLEGAYNEYLRGQDGLQLQKRITGGYTVPIKDRYEVEPLNGCDLYTTIDVNIQDVAEKALLEQLQAQNAAYGSVVLMEVETGYIKAIANLKRSTSGNYYESFNHAVGSSTEPGSTFKLAALVAAIDLGDVDINQIIDCHNGVYTLYDETMEDSKPGGYGKISVKEAFAYSSNPGIGSLIQETYGKNPKEFIEKLKDMRLHVPLGIDIKGEGQPYIPEPGDSLWSGISLPWMSIGYGLKQTPLQTLAFYNAIANDGKMMKPQLVKKITRGDK